MRLRRKLSRVSKGPISSSSFWRGRHLRATACPQRCVLFGSLGVVPHSSQARPRADDFGHVVGVAPARVHAEIQLKSRFRVCRPQNFRLRRAKRAISLYHVFCCTLWEYASEVTLAKSCTKWMAWPQGTKNHAGKSVPREMPLVSRAVNKLFTPRFANCQ